MRFNECLTIFHVSILYCTILSILILTLDADGEDLKCETQLKVRRNTVYEAFVGEDLRINCIVAFCNSSPPTVSWMKLEKTFVPVNVSSSSHIKTNWKTSTQTEGISLLIFTNILSSDSGPYQCHSGGSVSHRINVSVHDTRETTTATWNNDTNDVEPSTVTWTTLKPDNLTQDSSLINVYCVVGLMLFVIIAVVVYVTPRPACKGVKAKTDPGAENRDNGSNPDSFSSV